MYSEATKHLWGFGQRSQSGKSQLMQVMCGKEFDLLHFIKLEVIICIDVLNLHISDLLGPEML